MSTRKPTTPTLNKFISFIDQQQWMSPTLQQQLTSMAKQIAMEASISTKHKIKQKQYEQSFRKSLKSLKQKLKPLGHTIHYSPNKKLIFTINVHNKDISTAILTTRTIFPNATVLEHSTPEKLLLTPY